MVPCSLIAGARHIRHRQQSLGSIWKGFQWVGKPDKRNLPGRKRSVAAGPAGNGYNHQQSSAGGISCNLTVIWWQGNNESGSAATEGSLVRHAVNPSMGARLRPSRPARAAKKPAESRFCAGFFGGVGKRKDRTSFLFPAQKKKSRHKAGLLYLIAVGASPFSTCSNRMSMSIDTQTDRALHK